MRKITEDLDQLFTKAGRGDQLHDILFTAFVQCIHVHSKFVLCSVTVDSFNITNVSEECCMQACIITAFIIYTVCACVLLQASCSSI